MWNSDRIYRPVVPYIVGAVVLCTCLSVADQITGLTTFAPNTPARASEVNANFGAIATVVNGNLRADNLAASSVGSSELQADSVSATHIRSDAVGSSELVESVTFGDSGQGGQVSVSMTTGDTKSVIGLASDSAGAIGGGIWLFQKGPGDNDVAVYAGAVGNSGQDGGLVSVSSAAGTPAIQLKPDGTIYSIAGKSFVHPHPNDPTRQVVYMSLEGGERGTYVRGTGRLVGGTAVIVPPEHWRLVSSTSGITVQVTPREDCLGLFVAEAHRERIVVRELSNGTSEAAFDYVVHGLRDGFEDHEVYQANTMFLPTGDVWPEALSPGNAKALMQNGILRSDRSVDHALVETVRALSPAEIPTRPPVDESQH